MKYRNLLNSVNTSKFLSRIVFASFFFLIIYIGLKIPTLFDSNSNLIIALITLTYAYLTYEILRNTREQKLLPYLNVELIAFSDFSNIPKELLSLMRETSKASDLSGGEDGSKNIILVKVENLGQTTAVDTVLVLKYAKNNLAQKSVPLRILNSAL
jgi:hypothetical protein